jgi:hypothetical protein
MLVSTALRAGATLSAIVRIPTRCNPEHLISRCRLWHKRFMSDSKPILQMYGPLHALSSRGLHVRESARSWKLVVPMSAELVDAVCRLCERLGPSAAASLLLLLDGFVRSSAELPEICLQRALDTGTGSKQVGKPPVKAVGRIHAERGPCVIRHQIRSVRALGLRKLTSLQRRSDRAFA